MNAVYSSKMNTINHLAKHFRELYFGNNWTETNLKSILNDVTWAEATHQVGSFNTITALVFHIHYFVGVALNVLEGNDLDGNDSLSFDVPEMISESDWKELIDTVWRDTEKFAAHVELMPNSKLWEPFWDEKYGNYYRNIQGIIEHSYYHMGQIVIIKELIRSVEASKS